MVVALTPVFQFPLLKMQEIHKCLCRNEVQQCVCGRKPVFPSQATRRCFCCYAIHASVSWPNRNTRLQRRCCASIMRMRPSPRVCPGSHTDVSFPVSCSHCEPVYAEDQRRQHITGLCNRDLHRELEKACSSVLPISRDGPIGKSWVHSCSACMHAQYKTSVATVVFKDDCRGNWGEGQFIGPFGTGRNVDLEKQCSMKEAVLYSQLCRPQPWYQQIE